jgi:hypothetical protein
LDKLNRFSRKYYSKLLIKGGLLFLTFGVLYFMAILGIEYFLWLNSTGRFVLFFLFLAVEIFLLYHYIAVPVFYLFKLKKGISNKEASLLIGKHFPEVGDKLFNLLDLAEDSRKSELLLASIQQRSDRLTKVPFTKAINFNESYRYLKYLMIPVLVVMVLWISGNVDTFFGSYKRVINYDTAYEPPAPFAFRLLSGDLRILEDQSLTVQVATEGKVQPTDVYIVVNGKEILLHKVKDFYEYTFTPPLNSTKFFFKANNVESRIYNLESLKTPSIQFFEIALDYPLYTKRPAETLKSTGSAIFPEGTKVSWMLKGLNTDKVVLISKDTSITLENRQDVFSMSKTIYNDFHYTLATSNQNVENYEKLDYHFRVIKDAFPSINAKQVTDSLNPNLVYFIGEASDDYQLRTIRLICYEENNQDEKQILNLSSPNANYNQFYYTFPSGLNLEKGRSYSYYFEAEDNDEIHNGKVSKTQVFSTAMLDDKQMKNRELEAQQAIIKGLDNTLEEFKKQEESLNELNREQKEKNSLNFNDQMQVKEFLKKQQEQEELMQKFSRELKDNLESVDKEDKLNEMLKERLERQEIEAKKNEKLLEELNKVADKIDKEELSKRLEELGKKQQNSQRNLEQLLELTKRYYVTEKAAQLARDLEKLANKQEVLSDTVIDSKSPELQKELNREFDNLKEELEGLKEDNKALKKPLDLQIDKNKEEAIKEDQKEALDELNKHEEAEEGQPPGLESKEKSAGKAKQKQKAASQKIREMSEELSSSSSAGGESTITEDAEMLRQILDNLVTFSFKQEKLFDQLEGSGFDMTNYSGSVRKQQELRNLFGHIDDSLFALSLRRAELSEFVNEQITEVYYNIDKSLESIADSKIYQGAAYEQYVINASNSLADFLANLLDNMQESMKAGSGSGNPNDGFQLPDIIKGQGELKEKMGQMGESGKEGAEGDKGKGTKEGDDGLEGGQGKGKEGNKGENGEGQGNGNNGDKDGNNGTNGSGGLSEDELKELYEIYKEQEYLKQQLESQMQDMIRAGDKALAQKLIKQMEDFENDLLENGITQRTMERMNFIEHQLLKLENASLKQGKKSERESQSNTRTYNTPVMTMPAILENYKNEIEILNRQALPLRQNYQERVRIYFRSDD